MNKIIIHFAFFCAITIAFSQPLMGKGYFDFHLRAQAIYNDIFELRLDEAKAAITELATEEPDNLITYHLDNYVDFFTLYVSEDIKAYKRMEKNRNLRLNAVEELGDKNSPYYLFIQAEIRLHWALLSLRFEEYLPAFKDINRAHKLLLENQELFPHFLANKKDLGILHAAVGTVPDNYRWALELLSSLEGTIEEGKKEIEFVLNAAKKQHFPYLIETKVLYSFLLLQLDGRPEAAWNTITTAGLRPSKTPLHAFIMAKIAMRTGRNEQAINWISNTPKSEEFYPFPYLNYMLGNAKLRHLDTSARQHFHSFLATTKGSHSIKEAYQKLAWADLLDANPTGYKHNINLLLKRGTSSSGGDKNAEKEALDGITPNIHLLKARLLFDGGYYDRANGYLSSFNESHFIFFIHQLELSYRKGRILHGLKNYPLALEYYNKTIAAGRTHEAFYACNAALQAGLIEEKRGHQKNANQYFDLCLSLNPVDYRSGLHQQAKAGILRIQQSY